jgi:hypothetical protein
MQHAASPPRASPRRSPSPGGHSSPRSPPTNTYRVNGFGSPPRDVMKRNPSTSTLSMFDGSPMRPLPADKPAWGIASRRLEGGHNPFASPDPYERRRPPPRPLVPGTLPQPPARWATSFVPHPNNNPILADKLTAASYRKPDQPNRPFMQVIPANERKLLHVAARAETTPVDWMATQRWMAGERSYHQGWLDGRFAKRPPNRMPDHLSRATTPHSPSSSRSPSPSPLNPKTQSKLLPMRERASASGFASEPFAGLTQLRLPW